MSHAHCTWLDRILLPLPHSTPSLFHPLKWSISCNPQHGIQFAEQSPITGYEPNDLVEDSSTEVATMFQPSRRASVGSTYNSGEDIATTLASSDLG